jgi:hypothetical protein
MSTLTKTASDQHIEEQELYKALRTWYMFPGLQRELRNKENEAVQIVLEILERRRTAQKNAAGKSKDL